MKALIEWQRAIVVTRITSQDNSVGTHTHTHTGRRRWLEEIFWLMTIRLAHGIVFSSPLAMTKVFLYSISHHILINIALTFVWFCFQFNISRFFLCLNETDIISHRFLSMYTQFEWVCIWKTIKQRHVFCQRLRDDRWHESREKAPITSVFDLAKKREREIRSQRDVSSRSDMILSIKDRSKLITIDVDDDIWQSKQDIPRRTATKRFLCESSQSIINQ